MEPPVKRKILILERKDSPIIFVSSHMEPEIIQKTEDVTSFGYIVKRIGARRV